MKTRFKTGAALLYAGTALFTMPAALPALAQQAPGLGGPLEEIVVTARRREETLQDVPVAVTAFTAEALENQGAIDITNLQQSTPNLTLQVARGSNSTLISFIRGVGQQDPLWGFEPGVGLYFDDVYVARPQGAVLDIFDIERIEVLRGPQGTLYGRNTIGGAVKYVTRKIGDEASLRVKGNLGSYGQRDLIVSGGLPINSKVSIGAAGAVLKRDGYGENVSTGAEHYNKDVRTGRLTLEATPTDALFFRLSADATRDTSAPRHGYRLTPTPTGEAPLDDIYDTRSGAGDENSVETRGISLLGEWNVTDMVTLKSITAYRDGNTDTIIDFDGLPEPILDIPAFYEDDQFSQEFQALFTGDRWQGVAGVYYMDANAAGAFDTVVGNLGVTILTAGEVKTESWAAFADVSYDLTDALSLSVGARYTEDTKEGTVFRANYLGLRSPTFGGSQTGPLGAPLTDYTNERTFSEFTPRVSLSYELTDDINTYASFSQGFKSGGFDMRGDASLIPTTTEGYDPETVDSYEVGVKGAFFDRRLRLNLAAFYADYKNMQFTQQTPTLTGNIASDVGNAGQSTIKGVELEGFVSLTQDLSASFSVGWIEPEFEEFRTFVLNPAFDPAQPAGPSNQQFIEADVSDTRVFQNTPEWTGNLTLTYNRDLGNYGYLTVTGAASYRDSYSLFETPNPLLDENGYTLLDLSLVWTNEAENIKFGLHGRNLTDQEYRVGGYVFPGALFGNSITAFYGPPRTVTATVEFLF
ncbi:TonB-dependent receptor [Indioceanicola profundi]|uniref:TonB-dependent receptor n=1 Tax=Indioceanicola profundi TaxID=2220096 RepID=UPI000E6AA3B8|nr:TonB-dependent receptor [Indioceanicola profundi]